MSALIAMIFVGMVIIAIGVARTWRKSENRFLLVIYMVLGVLAIFFGSFELGREITKGIPSDSIEPGKYKIVAAALDNSIITGPDSISYLVLEHDKKIVLYALPTNELQGTPKEGGILEISEIPSSQKMIFR